jgi:adenine-specific DNA methylase
MDALKNRWFLARVFKTFLLAWMIVVAFGAFAFAGYLGLRETHSYSEEIQASRQQFFIATCEETNTRHDITIAKLDAIIKNLPPGERKRLAIENREGNVALIETLVPKRDCAKYARRVELPDT